MSQNAKKKVKGEKAFIYGPDIFVGSSDFGTFHPCSRCLELAFTV